jgi:hypothetical protein
MKPFARRPVSSIILLPVLLFAVRGAPAQTGPSEDAVRENLERIRLMFEKGKPASDWWWTGWLAGYGVATVAQGAVGLTTDDPDTREDMALGAATTLLGVLGQVVSPMVSSSAPARFSEMRESTPEERLLKLTRAEDLLKRCAGREREGRSWKMHALTGAVNLTGGLVVWLGFKRTAGEGALNFALNTLVTEAQIWTQPVRAVRDKEAYFRDREKAAGRIEVEWSFRIRPAGAGAGLCIRF